MATQEVTAHGGSERYYYADGKKVPIVASQRFVAVRSADPAAEAATASKLKAALPGAAALGQVIELPEHNLTVVALEGEAQGSRLAATETMRNYVSAQPGMAPGPVVYELDRPGSHDGLVAVGELLVKFKPEIGEDVRKRLLERNKLEVKQAKYPEPDAYVLTIKGDQDPIDLANKLHEHEAVDYAEPCFAVLTERLAVAGAEPMPGVENGLAIDLPLLMPEPDDMPAAGDLLDAFTGPVAPATDPNFPSQWGLRKINAPQAWDISMGSPAIAIAIIDEGNDLSHEDIDHKLPGYDAYDGDNNPTPQPADAHGTACAGVAAARANNGKGGAGVAPRCKVLPIRIARGVGGGFWDTSPAKVADGIRKAVDRGGDVLSNSYGVGPSSAVTNAFRYAQTNGRAGKGCPIAAATGNGDVRDVIYPAELSPSIPGFMAVGASNQWDQRKSRTSLDGENWWGSNYGPEVDVVAPGVQIFTTDIMGAAGYTGGNYVPNFNGTSSATPHVAGLMGLILSVDPDLRSWEVEDIIKLAAVDLGAAGRDEHFGFGRIDCRRALEAASRIWYQVSVQPVFLGSGRECFMRLNVRVYNPGINSVRLNSLNVTSHSPDWSAEIGRLEYRPNPGGVMRPRSSDDVRLNNVLLRANGNANSWSYRWALNWTYTFWRPSAPGFPLSASDMLAEAEGRSASGRAARGAGDSPTVAQPMPGRGAPDGVVMTAAGDGVAPSATNGDLVTIDRQSRSITVVIR